MDNGRNQQDGPASTQSLLRSSGSHTMSCQFGDGSHAIDDSSANLFVSHELRQLQGQFNGLSHDLRHISLVTRPKGRVPHRPPPLCPRCVDLMTDNERLRVRISITQRQTEKIAAFKRKYNLTILRFENFIKEQRLGEEIKAMRRRIVELELVIKSLLKRLQSSRSVNT